MCPGTYGPPEVLEILAKDFILIKRIRIHRYQNFLARQMYRHQYYHFYSRDVHYFFDFPPEQLKPPFKVVVN